MKCTKKLVVVRKMFLVLALLCLAAIADVSIASAANQVADAKQGVLQIELFYVDKDGNEHLIQTGSGFLVGAESGATTVITNEHVISIAEDDKKTYTEMFGVDFSNTKKITLQIKVVVQNDVVIPASYINGSAKSDFAILQLSQPIYTRTPLKIANSDNVAETDDIYALGFPFLETVAQDNPMYTSDDVTITNGKINKITSIDSIQYIMHDAKLSYGNSGGPLVDENGNVVGINTMYSSDGTTNYYYSVAINQVSSAMDSLGVVYEKASEENVSEEPEQNDELDATEEPDSANDSDQTDNEEENVENIQVPTESPTAEPVMNDIVEESKSPVNYIFIIGIIAAVFVVILVVVIIIVATNKSKKKNKVIPNIPTNNMNNNVMGAQPQMGAKNQTSQGQQGRPPVPPAFNGTISNVGGSETSVLGGGAGETSVLGGGAGETSVLSANIQPAAILTRNKNGESVKIAKANYTIGKERAKVDFCVSGNTSISRVHARIVCRDGDYYIVDNNSTNFTYVNGNKLTPGQEMKLSSGDKIKLSDEEFSFRMQ